MSIKNWFKGKDAVHKVQALSQDEELERIQDALEDEMLADHLTAVHAVKVQPPGELEVHAAEPAEPALEMQVQHLLEYHSVFHRRLWGTTSEMTQAERETVAEYLDILANNMGYRGMYLGCDQVLEIASHLRDSRMQSSLLSEPWMSPFKLRRRDVRELYIYLCNQAFALLAPVGEPIGVRKERAGAVDDAKETIGRFDLRAFETLKSSVEAVALEDGDLRAVSLARNMDYVLACSGDRAAMSRMAVHMEFLIRNDPFVSTREEGDVREDEIRKVVGRSWMRLATSISHAGNDPFSIASDWLADIWLDLRYIDGSGANTAERRGLVIPSLGPDQQALPFRRAGWRDDRYSGDRPRAISASASEMADADISARSKAISDALEVLGSFEVKGDTDSSGADVAADDGLEAMLRKAENNAVLKAALAAIDNSALDGDGRRERSLKIARTFASAVSSAVEPREGTAAELLSNLFKKGQMPETWGGGVAVLDHIGPSEAIGRNEGRAEDIYGRLLQPLPLSVCTLDGDGIYETLQAEFPWMKEANQIVAVAAARQSRQKEKHWRLKPTLLLGPPGVGKTRWIRRVSELSSVPTHTISLSGITHSKSIIGSERGWASARPSFMAYGFLNTMTANPIFHVDELDKTGASPSEANAQDAFLPILEQETSRGYPDIYLLGKLDLRWASFLFSANDLSKVSPELLTRLKVVNVRRPTRGEVMRVIPSMIREACRNENFTEDEVDAVSSGLESKAMRIFLDTSDLRDVQRHIEDEVRNTIWKPKGLHLVES